MLATCLSKIAAIPLAPEKAQTSPRPLKTSSKASASPLIQSIGPSGSPSTKLPSLEYAPTLGYELKDEAGYENTMSEFEKHIGFKYLKAVHLNDSKFDTGTRKEMCIRDSFQY